MKLLSLILDNFKGIRHFELKTDGRSVVVRAANGAGKTTLQDAYWWLLTGKNADLSAEFDVYPYDAPAGVEASVSGAFQMDDGTAFTLRRTYKQRVEPRRGDTEATVRGNKTEYFINDVPKSQGEYKAFCADHFGGGARLLMLSKLHYFPLDLNWSDRRQMLIDLFAPHMDDIDIVRAHEELKPLEDCIGAMITVEDYAQQAKAQRKKIKSRLEQIPARIDEANNAKPEIPPEADSSVLPSLAKRKMKLNNTINSLTNGENAATLRQRIAELKAKAAEARAEYMRDTAGGNEHLQMQATQIREKLQKAEEKQMRTRREKQNCEAFCKDSETELQTLRERAKSIHYEVFDPSKEKCPYCGQDLPADRLEDLRSDNVRRLNEVTAKGKDLSALRASQLDLLSRLTEDLKTGEDWIAMLQDHLREVTKMVVTPQPWETTTDARAYAVEIKEYEDQLQQIDTLSARQLESARMELAEVEAQFAEITSRAAVVEQREKIDARIQELMDEEKRLSVEIARLDHRLELTEQFVQLQAKDIEDKINSAFKDVRWVLFDRQVNGGIAPCCRAMLLDHNGLYVDYGHNANTANTYNGGLHIIEGLAKATGLQLPVWIDKAECCTDYAQIDNQVIRLQVSTDHPEISVEVLA